MAAWRRNALRLFPELHDEIERDAFSSYALFFMLLPFARDATSAATRTLCAGRTASRSGATISGAAANSQTPSIAFYEHLFDDWSLRQPVAPWLSPHIRHDVWPLWRARLDEPKLTELRRLLDGYASPRWQDLRGVVPD